MSSIIIFLFDTIQLLLNGIYNTTTTSSTNANHIDIDTNDDENAPDTPTRSYQDDDDDDDNENKQHNLIYDDTSSFRATTTMAMTTATTPTPTKKANRSITITIETCCNDESNSIQIQNQRNISTKVEKKPSVKSVQKKLLLIQLILVLLEICLLNSFIVYETIQLINYIAIEYVVPWIQIQRWTKNKKISYCTYYGRKCYMSDKTATSPTELLLDHTNITNNIVKYMNVHGATIIPNLLSETTASQLRSYILHKNQQLGKSISLMNMKHRWSFSLQVNDDNNENTTQQHEHSSSIVHIAMKELLDNKHLIDGIEQLIGHVDPAIIELTAITSEYGATQQQYHPDSEGHASGTLYTRNFIPSYSLFIPLQNITYNMGSTVIAPGTHMCDDGYPQGFPISGTTNNWQLGTGVLMNSQLQHYGSAYNDPTGPKRVILIPTFTSRPLVSKSTTNKLHSTKRSNNINNHKRVVDSRIISHGTVYGIHWTQLGHTVSDWYKHNMNTTYRTFRSLQLLSNHPTYTSWSFWDQTINRIAISEVDINIADVVNQYIPNTTLLHYFLLSKASNTTTTLSTTNTTSNAVVTIPALDEYEEKEHGTVLTQFVLECITRLCHLCSLLIVSLLTLYVVFQYHLSTTRNRNNMASVPKIQSRNIVSLLNYRVLIICFIIHLLYKCIAWYYIDQSIWGINIRNKRSLNLPRTFKQYPNTVSTLPTKLDILLTNHIQSQYLGAYSKIIDMKHPGNVYWYNELIPQQYKNNTSSYYHSLSIQLKYDICNTIVTSLVRNEQRRILSLNRIGQWTVLTNDEAIRFCHTTFMIQSNHYIKDTVQQIDYLWTETQYGYFRDTILHRTHIPLYLTQLRNRITHYTIKQQPKQQQQLHKSTTYRATGSIARQINQRHDDKNIRIRNDPVSSKKINTNRFQPKLSRFHSTIVIPTTTQSIHINRGISSHPLNTFDTSKSSIVKLNEPFRLAWITVGNTIEILSNDEENNPFWYIGRVISVESYHTAINVHYLTGEKLYNIDRTSLRRFVQYKINEKVQVDIDNTYVYDDAIIISFVPSHGVNTTGIRSVSSSSDSTNNRVVYQGKRQKGNMIKVYLVGTKTYHIVFPKALRRISIVDNEEST